MCLGPLAAATRAETRSRVATNISAAPGQTIERDALGATAPRPIGQLPDDGSRPSAHAGGDQPIAHAASIHYLGGPVLHASRTYLIFWQPQGAGLSFDAGYTTLITQFVRDVASDSHRTTNAFALTGEYHDGRGPAAYASAYGGSLLDTDPLPSKDCTEPGATGPGWSLCLTDAQIQDELTHFVTSQSLPTHGDDLYVLLTPYGLGDCQDSSSSSCALGGASSGYCGYHSWTNSGILYAVVPYNAVSGHCQSDEPRPNASSADPALSTILHEQVETVTDPYGNGWISPGGNEIADVCLTDFGTSLGGSGSAQWNQVIGGHHYWLQEIYGRLQGRCKPRPLPDRVAILSARRLAAGAAASFVGHARQPGGAVKSYNWSFGDGRGAGGPSVSHVYTRPGTYHVVLRITDSAGNWAYATRAVRVTRSRRGAAPPQAGA
jgi:hypothetical protein